MIQVTLSFPDQAALVAFFAAPATVAEAKVDSPKPVKAAKPAPAPAVVQAPPTVEPEVAPAPAAAPAVDYPTLQKAVFALASKSRDSAAAVAASMGVKTFKELGQDKWAEALAAVNAALAA